MGVVYKIPFSCGKAHIAQPGPALDLRAKYHFLSLRSMSATHLAVHINRCAYTLMFKHIDILERHPQNWLGKFPSHITFMYTLLMFALAKCQLPCLMKSLNLFVDWERV